MDKEEIIGWSFVVLMIGLLIVGTAYGIWVNNTQLKVVYSTNYPGYIIRCGPGGGNQLVIKQIDSTMAQVEC